MNSAYTGRVILVGMNRRTFLSLSGGALASMAPAAAANAPMPLGINTYCLRALRWNDRKLLEYTAGLRMDAVFLQDSIDTGTAQSAHWAEVRSIAKNLGLHLETGGGSVLPKGPDGFNAAVETLRLQIARAKGMGSPLVRCNIANGRTALPEGSPDQHIDTVVRVFKAVRSQVLDAGLKLALEVHKDFQAWEFKNLIEAAGTDFVGIYMDTGNPVYVLEHPLTTLETLAPYVLTLHLRDSVVYEHSRGVAVQWVPLGEGSVDFKQIMARAQVLCPNVYVYVKPITGRPPDILPYLEADFWKLYPKARAADLARFLQLAKTGHPYEGHVVIEDLPGRPTPPQFLPAIQFQQQEHMERSVEYAKKTLNLGRRWRS